MNPRFGSVSYPRTALPSSKPTPRQEFIGRAALVVLGLLIGAAGTALGWHTIKIAASVAKESEGRTVAHLSLPLLVVACFLDLVALVLIVLAFVPAEDKRPGPPRGFATLSRLFDGLWAVVESVFRSY